MICPNCNNSFLAPAILSIPLVITYRGFKKEIGCEVSLECSYCPYSVTERNTAIDMELEISKFKVEINRQLSLGDVL